MKPLISMSHAAFLLALAAFAAIAWAGHIHPLTAPTAGPAAEAIAAAGLGLFAAALLLCLFQGINRLAEWRHEIRKRLDPDHPDYQP